MRVLSRSISSLLEPTNIEQKIEEERLLKEFNAESSLKIINCFVNEMPGAA